jgi:hypothetical protein
MNPQKIAKKPINRSKYLALYTYAKAGYYLPKKHSPTAQINRTLPCPMSPNIIPNKNGKVTVVKKAGLISLYEGMPYVSTISW